MAETLERRKRSQKAVITAEQTIALAFVLLTKSQLAERLRLSPRTIDNMMAQRIIPFIRASKRSVRFHLPRVLAALEKREVREVTR